MNLITRFYGLCAVASLLLNNGCRPHDGRTEVREHVLMHTSFEELPYWSNPPHVSLTTAKAHSGQVALCLDSAREFSAAYRKALGSLCTHRPRQFTFSAWVWAASAADDAIFVVAIASPNDRDHPFFTKNIFINHDASYGKWKKVSSAIELPSTIHADHEIVIYLWRGGAQTPVYTDDWSLTELH